MGDNNVDSVNPRTYKQTQTPQDDIDFVGRMTSHDVIMFVICDFTICTESQKEHELGVKYQDVILECKKY